MPAAVETMFSGNRMTPWHREGTVLDGVLTAAEALQASGLDWEVEKRPLYVRAADDGYVEVPRKYATVRTSDGSALGVVGEQYEVLQNEDAFAFADGLVDDGDAKYETAGSLKGGRAVWMLMNVPKGVNIEAEGEATDLYLALSNSHDGTSAITAMVTPVRIVCANTLNLALNGAPRKWTVRHVGTLESKMHAARESLGLTFEYADELGRLATELANQKISDNAFERIVADLTDVEKTAEGIIETYRTSPNLANIRGTKWGAVNAVGEFMEHGKTHRSEEARLLSTYGGAARQMRDKALELITA